MMTNLFSIFDPSTPNFLSSNWLSVFILFLMTPLTMWISTSRSKIIITMIPSYILTEFKPLIKKSKFSLILPVSLMMFIMFNNLLGLSPYIFTASSHMVFSLSLALPFWLGFLLYGWLNNTSNLLIHLIPVGTPSALMPFMVLIETISNLIRPITLSIRLAANMIAGHLLLVLLSSTTMISPFITFPLLIISQMLLNILEIAVAFIQAYVFSVLLTLYSSEVI